MAERIAVFIGQVNQEYQVEMVQAVETAARQLGYGVDVFSEFGSYGDNYLHAEGERTIIKLPYVEDYAGVIIAPDTFGVKEMEKQLDILLLAKMKGPVVSIRQEKDCFYSVQVDNQTAMAKMVEHFAKDHGFKRICFMKGRDDLKDAQERYQGYLDIMEKYNLPVTPYMVFQGDYWRGKAKEAVEWFLSGPEKPEAIVCANDYMAVSVLDELKKRGIRVPEDMALSGFDDIEETRYVEPSLTTLGMPCKEIGEEAVRLIDRLVHGGKSPQILRLPIKLIPRCSCGCGKSEYGHWIDILYNEKLYLRNVIVQNGFMNADYDNYDQMDELLEAAYQFAVYFDYRNIYICLCESAEKDEEKDLDEEATFYTENMILRAVMNREHGVTHTNERFSRRNLLPPQYYESGGCYVFFPLHHKNRCLGYVVLDTENLGGLKDFFVCWTSELCSTMDKVLLYEENKNLQEFRMLSTVDDLTGIYNRRKWEQELSKMVSVQKLQKVKFFIVSLDMDGLKTINDTYGHLEGDAALRAYADVLRNSIGEKEFCFRIGGDEFTLLLPTGDEEHVKQVLNKIEENVKKFNESSNKPYQLAGSMGYAEYKRNEELTNCIRRADINMYADKMARKKGRE